MQFIKKIAVSMWETIVEDFTKLPKIAIKSLFFCPAYYIIYRVVSHHAPPLDMWCGYFIGAIIFTSAPKKPSSRQNKEAPQQPSTAIILPTSMTSSANSPR